MDPRQISHETVQVSGSKESRETAPWPAKAEGDNRVRGPDVGEASSSYDVYAQGIRGCVQHLPWLTQS
jgi:hypothetical protein